MKIKLTQALINVTNNKVLVKVGQVLKVDYIIKEKTQRFYYCPYTKMRTDLYTGENKTRTRMIRYGATYKNQEYVIPANAAEVIKEN